MAFFGLSQLLWVFRYECDSKMLLLLFKTITEMQDFVTFILEVFFFLSSVLNDSVTRA